MNLIAPTAMSHSLPFSTILHNPAILPSWAPVLASGIWIAHPGRSCECRGVLQVPGMANLGLNAVSHALPLGAVPGAGMQPASYMNSGGYSTHAMPMQPPAQMVPPQAYAAQVSSSPSTSLCHTTHCTALKSCFHGLAEPVICHLHRQQSCP